MSRIALPLLSLSALLGPGLLAESDAQAQKPKVDSATVQVTATRFPEDVAKVPASLTVVTGQDLADRGVTDLRGALALVPGLSIAPGGDGGPASGIPAFMGLREMDAYLLVVDGTPWGGAFNPAMAALDLGNVERIEVQRGAAPVMYGATSFVGIIHIIHRAPGETQNGATLTGGSHHSYGAAITLKTPQVAGFDSALSAGTQRQGVDDPKAGFTRNHLTWRTFKALAEGSLHADLSIFSIDQQPASPHPRVGKVLDPNVPLDANHNPEGAYLRETRAALAVGYDRKLGEGLWRTTLSATRSRRHDFRGFLAEVEAPDNANGWRLTVDQTDLFLDSHVTLDLGPKVKVVGGVDHLQGQGTGRGGDFDYPVALDGSNPPGSSTLAPAADIRIDDHRAFSGLYGFVEFNPFASLVLEGGLRLNHTRETRNRWERDLASQAVDQGSDRHTTSRLSGSLGLTWTFWSSGSDKLALFGSYRNTFKPAAMDFGLDSGTEMLDPESAHHGEVGVKGSLFGGRLGLEVGVFRLDFQNMVVSQDLGNGPVLVNAGRERFQGVEGALTYRFAADLNARATWSYHDSRFTDAVQVLGGTALNGKRLEMSPYNMGGLGLVYAPRQGFVATAEASYLGPVYLNKRNTAPSAGFTTLGGSLGWRGQAWECRVTGQNLTDKRNPVAESELGDAQYYRMAGRRVDVSLRFAF